MWKTAVKDFVESGIILYARAHLYETQRVSLIVYTPSWYDTTFYPLFIRFIFRPYNDFAPNTYTYALSLSEFVLFFRRYFKITVDIKAHALISENSKQNKNTFSKN